MTLTCELPKFQKEKLQSLYRFFVQCKDGEEAIPLDNDRMKHLFAKILEFTGWTSKSTEAKRTKGVLDCFFESMLEKCNIILDMRDGSTETEDKKALDSLTLDNWFKTWSFLLREKKGLEGLPIWVTILPTVLLDIIDHDDDGVISFEELQRFYQELLPATKDVEERILRAAYNKMTDTGTYPLDIQTLEQLFSNFLIGKTPFAPGKYLFWCHGNDATATPKVKILRDFNEERNEGDKVTVERKRSPTNLKKPEVPRPRKQSIPSLIPSAHLIGC